ncbi:MAG: hypothetical protein CFH01_00349 [Alphaproteobacteria bacterium MarineAlpha2_Bin1]|nr:MAG: hypothetical protein CFH01_00349 [Alphaproteobacteria bacterium MarineAlpha2_Bin1]
MDDIYSNLLIIFSKVLKDENIELLPETTADDINGWDSLTNIRILVTIESEFNIKFNADEVSELKNIGELVENIKNKLN